MMKSGSSSKGFSLFTPLVGTSIVIMALIIATGMLQNDIRLSRSLSSSYEVSAQSLLAKLIKAGAEVQILSNMEEITYRQVGIRFECDSKASCDSEVSNRLMKTDLTYIDSVYSSLMNFNGIFLYITESVDNVLSGSGTGYVREDSSAIETRFSTALGALDDPNNLKEPILFGYTSDGRYYVKIVESKFDQSVFAISFEDRRTQDSMKVSIAPYGFNFTTDEPLGLLIGNATELFVDSDSNNLETNLQNKLNPTPSSTEFSTAYSKAWFKEDHGIKRLIIEFYKGYGGTDYPYNITFQEPGFSAAPDDNDLECDASRCTSP